MSIYQQVEIEFFFKSGVEAFLTELSVVLAGYLLFKGALWISFSLCGCPMGGLELHRMKSPKKMVEIWAKNEAFV